MGQIFQSFITGNQAGREDSEQRRRRNALDQAGTAYGSGDTEGAENALMAAGLVNEAGAYSALAEARRNRTNRTAITGAMTLDPNATPQQRAEAGANAALSAGDTDQWFQFRQASAAMSAQERAEAAERTETAARLALTVLPSVPFEQRAERAVQEAVNAGHSEEEARRQVANLDLSDEGLQALGQASLTAADIHAGRERRERYDVQDRQQDRQYGLQAAQFNLQREQADRQAAMQEQMFGSEAVEYAARQYRQTGRMPSLGSGQTGTAMRQQVLARAAQMARAEGSTAEADIITQRSLAANSQALGRITTQRAQIHNFEQTALRNLDLAVAASERVGRTGSPIINDIMLEARRRGTGDPDVQQLTIAIETFAEEYAKVMSGATGGAAATDSAREQAHRMINSSMTVEQIRAVSEQMRAEMANRMHSLDAEQQSLTEAMRTPYGEAVTQGDGATPHAGGETPGATTAPTGNVSVGGRRFARASLQSAIELVRSGGATAEQFRQRTGVSVEDAERSLSSETSSQSPQRTPPTITGHGGAQRPLW